MERGLSRRMTGMFLTCSYLVFVVVIAVGEAVGSDPVAARAAVVGALALFVAAYTAFWWSTMAGGGWDCDFSWSRTGLAAVVCAVSVGLALVRFEAFGYLFIYCTVVLAGLLPLRTSWIAMLAVGTATLLMIFVSHSALIDWFWLPITATLSGLGVTFGRRMNQYTVDLRVAREEIARLAVSEERLRFARDLHDLLGQSLSVVVLKAELAGRLAAASPERAAEEMADVERVAREALREVRDAVAGYRQPSLDQELESARGALGSAGVLARFEPVAGPMPAGLDATLAWALREGVTNIVRHSRARHAEAVLARDHSEVRLELLDDGVGCEGCEPGNGLKGLRERVEARGGRLHWGPRQEGGFRLAVALPLKEAPQPAVTA